MAWIVKWSDLVPGDDAPYLVNGGQPGRLNTTWASAQKMARRFATKRAAREEIEAFPWLSEGLVKILRLRPRTAPEPTMPPQEPPPRPTSSL